jgi:D-3-phosphoglycerate dehydrogenase
MDDTKGLFNEKSFSRMKKGVVLLNFSRDKIVKDTDVLSAIKSEQIRSYVTDFPTDQFINVENVICIPHLGASTKESEDNCAIMAVDELMDYLENGNITRSVNFPKSNMGKLTAPARACILHKNIPSMLQMITSVFGQMNININEMINHSKGEYAYTMMDIDSEVDEGQLRNALMSTEGIITLRVLYADDLS